MTKSSREEESSESRTLHIALLPWLAFGHMIPFLQLAIALANLGHRISFISTPRNIKRLPGLPTHLSSLITFVRLPLPPVDGLPEDAEATVDLPLEQTPYLKISYDSLRDAVRQFVEQESPDWLLHDFIPHWAAGLGVPTVFFSVYSGCTLSFTGPPEAMTEEGRRRWRPSAESLTAKPEWVPFDSAVAFLPVEAEAFYAGAFETNESGMSDVERFGLALDGCSVVAIRSCNEYEGDHLELLNKLYRKPVVPVGILPPEAPVTQSNDANWRRIKDWLDGQKPKSVVFVSFGSEYKLSEPEVHELAYGLELSNVPFFWALRRPAWVTGGDDEALPEGFIGRTAGRGTVSFGWAPQLEILAHPSVGGSLFHSGWGSIIETLRYGHALVALPTIFDQGLNARLLVEKGLAVEVEKKEDGGFDREKIARALVMVMSSDEGEEIRANARRIAHVFADQSLHDRYVKEFVDFLLKFGK